MTDPVYIRGKRLPTEAELLRAREADPNRPPRPGDLVIWFDFTDDLDVVFPVVDRFDKSARLLYPSWRSLAISFGERWKIRVVRRFTCPKRRTS